jgi:hypothetical protein
LSMNLLVIGFFTLASVAVSAEARDLAAASPQAPNRSFGQNYKDMVLATCVANAYKNDKAAPADAGSSVAALRDWTYYDLEKSPDAVKSLIDSYLARDYRNPLAESEAKGVKFDLLKCLDLYHSKELEAQVKQLVANPNRMSRQGYSTPAGTR